MFYLQQAGSGLGGGGSRLAGQDGRHGRPGAGHGTAHGVHLQQAGAQACAAAQGAQWPFASKLQLLLLPACRLAGLVDQKTHINASVAMFFGFARAGPRQSLLICRFRFVSPVTLASVFGTMKGPLRVHGLSFT